MCSDNFALGNTKLSGHRARSFRLNMTNHAMACMCLGREKALLATSCDRLTCLLVPAAKSWTCLGLAERKSQSPIYSKVNHTVFFKNVPPHAHLCVRRYHLCCVLESARQFTRLAEWNSESTEGWKQFSGVAFLFGCMLFGDDRPDDCSCPSTSFAAQQLAADSRHVHSDLMHVSMVQGCASKRACTFLCQLQML